MRGTVFHERRTGEQATVFQDEGHVLLRVSCRSAGSPPPTVVPYALAVSFEAGIDTGIDVYEPIRARLAARVRAGVRQ